MCPCHQCSLERMSPQDDNSNNQRWLYLLPEKKICKEDKMINLRFICTTALYEYMKSHGNDVHNLSRYTNVWSNIYGTLFDIFYMTKKGRHIKYTYTMYKCPLHLSCFVRQTSTQVPREIRVTRRITSKNITPMKVKQKKRIKIPIPR